MFLTICWSVYIFSTLNLIKSSEWGGQIKTSFTTHSKRHVTAENKLFKINTVSFASPFTETSHQAHSVVCKKLFSRPVKLLIERLPEEIGLFVCWRDSRYFRRESLSSRGRRRYCRLTSSGPTMQRWSLSNQQQSRVQRKRHARLTLGAWPPFKRPPLTSTFPSIRDVTARRHAPRRQKLVFFTESSTQSASLDIFTVTSTLPRNRLLVLS